MLEFKERGTLLERLVMQHHITHHELTIWTHAILMWPIAMLCFYCAVMLGKIAFRLADPYFSWIRWGPVSWIRCPVQSEVRG